MFQGMSAPALNSSHIPGQSPIPPGQQPSTQGTAEQSTREGMATVVMDVTAVGERLLGTFMGQSGHSHDSSAKQQKRS